jgi:K+-sensing histidine kinase KdpD
LLENAIRCSPPDSVVVLRVGMKSGRTFLSVVDEGPGPPDPRLFQRHSKGEVHSGSLGLGLSIASEILRKHETELCVETSEKGGSAFTLFLSAP